MTFEEKQQDLYEKLAMLQTAVCDARPAYSVFGDLDDEAEDDAAYAAYAEAEKSHDALCSMLEKISTAVDNYQKTLGPASAATAVMSITYMQDGLDPETPF